MLESAPTSCLAVVVVEDDRQARQRLCEAIAAQDDLQLSASFAEARPAMDWLAGGNPVDILLTDLGLPDGSGIDVIKACAAAQPGCDIMVITMFGDDRNVLSSIEAGATGYVLKDSGQLDVMQAMRDLRAGGSPMSPLIARKVLNRALQGRPASGPAIPGETAGGNVVLTGREADTLNLIARGYTYAETAEQLSVSLSTIQTYIRNIYGKLSVTSRSHAVLKAHSLGLLQDDMFIK
jgi:DNA-binding NarL/FixJ family response regulator